MLSIFVEASCNRYTRDECVSCHVYEPLMEIPRSEWHLKPEAARKMADTIRQVSVLHQLARHEINLTGGEASQNPHIVEIFQIFREVTGNVCLHTNLEINSTRSKRWSRLMEIIRLGGRIDITLYPTAWERFQKPLLEELLKLQDRLLVNVVFENLPHLEQQIALLHDFFAGRGGGFRPVADLLADYHAKISRLIRAEPNAGEAAYTRAMGDTAAFARAPAFTFGLNLLPAFEVDAEGRRAMHASPFPRENYLIECPAARGSIDIMTVRQDGGMTPCCDVGNLLCQPRFGNLLKDTPEEIERKFEASRRLLAAGIAKNQANQQAGRAGEWGEEGIPPYCR